MSTNNFTFQNICVVVHEDNYDNTDSDLEYWGDCLILRVSRFERYTTRKWNEREALLIGEVPFYRVNGDLYATIYVTYKSGYYSGACLDYYTEFEQGTKIMKLEKAVKAKENRIRNVLRSFGDEYLKVGQFSNGEAVYQRASKK